MGDIVGVSTFIQSLVQRLGPLAADRYADQCFSLRSLLVAVLAVVGDVERKGRDSKVANRWLLHLRDAVFEVNDVIDEVELDFQIHLQKPGGVSFSVSCLNPFSNKSRLVQALKQSRYKLKEVLDQMKMIEIEMEPNFPIVPRGATSLQSWQPIASDIIGRERDDMIIKDAILNHVAAADSGVLVIGIVGVAGIGKTTLASLIYNDPQIGSKFDIMLWVVDGKQSRYHILQQLRVHVMEQNHLNLDQDIKSLEQLEEELCKLLDMKRVLLVLDDRLPGTSFHPEQVYGLLQNATPGSVVLVTSRSEQVVQELRASMIHQMGLLTLDDAYQLFATHAFASDVQIQPQVVSIAREVVKRCQGVPLTLKVLGKLMRNKDDLRDWREVLEKTDTFDNVQTVLNVIKDTIPQHLKLPFCTLELQQVFSVEEFICVWMALGFVYSDDPNQQPEHLGRKYLRELYDRTLIAQVEFAPGGVLTDFGLHDLVKEMAEKISFDQGFRSLRQDNILPSYVDKTIKYIVLEEDRLADADFLAKLSYSMAKLQLFVLCPGKQASAQILMNILSKFKSLRVLGLGGCSIEILPDSIGQLKHLRYLDVGRNELLSSLPDSICNLWHLQTLLLHGCHQLKKLPAGIGKLQNLRYLTLTVSQETLPEEIGQLTSLRTLGLYSCQCLISLPSTFKNLKKLQTLGIVDCPEVDLLASSSAEALRGMDGIDTLLLSGVPEFQHLPPNLGTPSVVMKHLLIQSSIKMSRIEWINQFLYLHSLTIEDCPELSTLAVDGNSQFNNMTELVLRNCPGLIDTKCVGQFVSLRSFIIDGCPDLAALDAGLAELKKLERLEIRRCPVLIESIERDSSYVSHVQVIELNGVPFNRPSKSKNPAQEDDSYSGSAMDIASSSNHVMSNSLSASEILEDSS